MRLLVANGYVIDPAQQVNAGKNLLIEDGRVIGLLDRSDPIPEDAELLDATGLIVAPGFVDLHVHLREPGQEYKERDDRHQNNGRINHQAFQPRRDRVQGKDV